MKRFYCYEFSIGKIALAEDGKGICNLFFVNGTIPQDILIEESNLLKETALQLDEYFSGKRKIFDIPLSLQGTKFQLKDWEALQTIPYGETRTYQEIAQQIGNPKSCRAVGLANKNNPVGIIIPCHRVIGKDGTLTGYAGGLYIKKALLELEKVER